MRLTKFNPETEQYEYKEPAKTQAEFAAQRKAAIQKLGEFEDRAEWISVEERLPEPNEECIVAAKVGNRMVTDSAMRVHCYNLRTQETTYAWEITHDWDEGEGCEITHWMPLPQPPKMKGENDEQR